VRVRPSRNDLVLAPLIALAMLAIAPCAADAQARRAVSSGETTRGSTRPVEARREVRDGSSSGASGSDSDDARATRVVRADGPRWSRRRRVRIAIVPGLALDGCARIVDGYCIQDRWEYVGDSMMGFGFSAGLVGALIATSNNPLSNARVTGAGLDAGLVPSIGVEGRAFLVYGRLRLGAVLQAGVAAVPGAVALQGAFEEGSQLGAGHHLGVWGFLAYAAHVADIVQLSIGGRAGWHLLELDVRWQNRLYDRVSRSFVSIGPEVGVRLDDGGPAGVMFSVFADLAQPGLVQATVAFHYEEPRPPTPAW
jgi:hypothetical protein